MKTAKVELGYKSTQGIKWTGIGEIWTRIVYLLTWIILSRILVPAEIGILSLFFLTAQMAHILFDFGFAATLIQKKNLHNKDLDTAFWTQLIFALVFSVLFVVFRTKIAEFIKIPQFEHIIIVFPLLFIGYSLTSIPQTRLIKEVEFKVLSQLQMISSTAFSVIAISLALWQKNYWSFVVAVLCEQIIFTILINMHQKWLPRFVFSKGALKSLFQFGGYVFANRIVNYLNLYIPSIFITKFLNTHLLGIYALAFQVIDFPVQRIAKNVLKVFFPVLAKLQDAPHSYNRIYKQLIYYLTIITIPIYLLIFIFSVDLIPIVLGRQWVEMIPVVRVLAILGVARSLWTLTSLVFLSRGYPQRELLILLILGFLQLPLFYFSVSKGLNYFVSMQSGLIACFLIVSILMSTQLIKIEIMDWLRQIKNPLIAGSGLVLIKYLFTSVFTPCAFLCTTILIIVSLSIYLIILMRLDSDLIVKMKSLIRA